jgi:Lsr2
MTQKAQTRYIDDIDGSDAEGTVRFGLDGADYEIDLNAAHSQELRASLQAYITHARKVGGSRRARRGARRNASAVDTHAVRTWAKDQGIDIKERGRVPADVVARYREATGQ